MKPYHCPKGATTWGLADQVNGGGGRGPNREWVNRYAGVVQVIVAGYRDPFLNFLNPNA